MNEMILGQIIAPTEKINHCTNAKSSIQNVKNSCNSKKNEWQESFRTLDNNSDLCEVKKTDLFEPYGRKCGWKWTYHTVHMGKRRTIPMMPLAMSRP